MSDNEKIVKTGLIDTLIDSFSKRPIITMLLLLFIGYLIWYFMGGPMRVEERYSMRGWALVFKHIFGF